jgi:hypothetical protein
MAFSVTYIVTKTVFLSGSDIHFSDLTRQKRSSFWWICWQIWWYDDDIKMNKKQYNYTTRKLPDYDCLWTVYYLSTIQRWTQRCTSGPQQPATGMLLERVPVWTLLFLYTSFHIFRRRLDTVEFTLLCVIIFFQCCTIPDSISRTTSTLMAAVYGERLTRANEIKSRLVHSCKTQGSVISSRWNGAPAR